MPDLRILIVADDPLARAGLVALIGQQPGLSVVGQATSLDDLSHAIDVYRPEVVLWDAGWDPAPSLDRLAHAGLDVPVAVLLPDTSEAGDALLAWKAEARGLLRRAAPADQLASALTAIGLGLTVVDPIFRPSLRQTDDETDKAPAIGDSTLVEPLTPRELEVLRLVAEGLPNKTIAARLNISEHTVKFHVNAVLGKLGAESRTEAVVRATRLGLILL
jgi:DNA-binding NarL/FixJ family response regulator